MDTYCDSCGLDFPHNGTLANHKKACGGPGQKSCRGCGETKSLDEFWQGPSRRNRRSRCRVCVTKRNRKNKLLREYGVTEEWYDERAAHGCAICGTMGDLVVDHDHESGDARGVLCRLHNAGIGMFQESPETLKLAAEYLLR